MSIATAGGAVTAAAVGDGSATLGAAVGLGSKTGAAWHVVHVALVLSLWSAGISSLWQARQFSLPSTGWGMAIAVAIGVVAAAGAPAA